MRLDPLSELADFILALRSLYTERKRGLLNEMVASPIKPHEDLIAIHAAYNALHEAERAIDIALAQIRVDKENDD